MALFNDNPAPLTAAAQRCQFTDCPALAVWVHSETPGYVMGAAVVEFRLCGPHSEERAGHSDMMGIPYTRKQHQAALI